MFTIFLGRNVEALVIFIGVGIKLTECAQVLSWYP